MPGNLHFFDTTLPRAADANGKSVEEQLSGIYNYLYMLLEQLRYTLSNLDGSNFNTAAFAPIADTIRKVDGLKIVVGAEGNEMTFSLTANGLVISSARQVELYSLTGELPPVGVVGGVYVNALGQNVLEHGWYDTYDDDWTGQNPVYCCATYNGGVNWGAVYIKSGVAGRQGYDGLAVVLNNNPHVFAGSESAALAGQATVGVIAMLGSVRQAVTINSVTGAPTGMSCAIHGSGTQNAYITVSVTTALTQQSGELSVNVTVGQQTFTLPWSWSVAYKGEKGAKGDRGSDASVTFANINNALAALFVKISQGDPTQVTDYYMYSPIIKAAQIFASKIYAGEGSGYSQMSATGLDVYTAGGAKKIGMGYNTTYDTDYPYIMLGQGTGYSGGGAAIVQKLGAGIWIGDDSIVAAGGSYPGNRNSAQDISGSYPYATGLFVDFDGDEIYRYSNGHVTPLGYAVFS